MKCAETIADLVQDFSDGTNAFHIHWPRSLEEEIKVAKPDPRNGFHMVTPPRETTMTDTLNAWHKIPLLRTAPLMRPTLLPTAEHLKQHPKDNLVLVTSRVINLRHKWGRGGREDPHELPLYHYSGEYQCGTPHGLRMGGYYYDAVTMPYTRFDRLLGAIHATNLVKYSTPYALPLNAWEPKLATLSTCAYKGGAEYLYASPESPIDPYVITAHALTAAFTHGPVTWFLKNPHTACDHAISAFLRSTHITAALHNLDPLDGIRHALPLLGDYHAQHLAHAIDNPTNTPPQEPTVYQDIAAWVHTTTRLATLAPTQAITETITYYHDEKPHHLELLVWLGAHLGIQQLAHHTPPDLTTQDHFSSEWRLAQKFAYTSHHLKTTNHTPHIHYADFDRWQNHPNDVGFTPRTR